MQDYLNDPNAGEDKYHRTALNSIHEQSMRRFGREALMPGDLEMMEEAENEARKKCLSGSCRHRTCTHERNWGELFV